jgi:hypothetical protein
MQLPKTISFDAAFSIENKGWRIKCGENGKMVAKKKYHE